jgi:hypothetical protein
LHGDVRFNVVSPRSKAFLDKLRVAQVVRKFHALEKPKLQYRVDNITESPGPCVTFYNMLDFYSEAFLRAPYTQRFMKTT